VAFRPVRFRLLYRAWRQDQRWAQLSLGSGKQRLAQAGSAAPALAGNVCAAESLETQHMYLLASAFFVVSLYSFYVGDISNARLVLGVAVVLAGARFFLGPQDEASVFRRIALGIGIFILIVAVTYTIRAFFG
jgi:hypothetical protein